MDAQAVLTALDAGDFTALVTALGPDESQDFVIPDVPGGELPVGRRTVTLARVGATVLKVGPGAGVASIEAHQYEDADTAHDRYRRAVAAATETLGHLVSLVAAVAGVTNGAGSRDANPPRWV